MKHELLMLMHPKIICIFNFIFLVNRRHCLSFAYHMYGYGTGSLRVNIYTLNGNAEEWREEENQGNAWKTTEVPIEAGTNDVSPIDKGLSWPWSYGSWINNYLCNRCLSPLKLRVRTPFRRGVHDTTLCDKVCHVTCERSVVFSGYSYFLHQ